MRSFQNFVVLFFFVFAFLGVGEVLGQNDNTKLAGDLFSGNTYAPAISQYVPPSDPNIAFDLYNAGLDREEQAKKDKLLLEIYTAYQDLEKHYNRLAEAYNGQSRYIKMLETKLLEQGIEIGSKLKNTATTYSYAPVYLKPNTNSTKLTEVTDNKVVILRKENSQFYYVEVNGVQGYLEAGMINQLETGAID